MLLLLLLVAQNFNPTVSSDNKQKIEKPWCEHCRRARQIKDTGWKLHGKPLDWKSRHRNDRDGRAYATNVASDNNITSESIPNSKEQIEALQKIIGHSIQGAGLVAQKVMPTALTANKEGMNLRS